MITIESEEFEDKLHESSEQRLEMLQIWNIEINQEIKQ